MPVSPPTSNPRHRPRCRRGRWACNLDIRPSFSYIHKATRRPRQPRPSFSDKLCCFRRQTSNSSHRPRCRRGRWGIHYYILDNPSLIYTRTSSPTPPTSNPSHRFRRSRGRWAYSIDISDPRPSLIDKAVLAYSANLSLSIYIYIYRYIYMDMDMYISIYIYMWVWVWVWVYVYVYVCMYESKPQVQMQAGQVKR